jgi:hypothetical protein
MFSGASSNATRASRCASTAGIATPQKRIDFVTGNCGVSLPTLFKRIGTMAADGQPLSIGSCAARPRRAWRPELARRTANPFAGPEAPAGPSVKDNTGKYRVRTGRQAGSRDSDVGRQGSDRRLPPARTTPTRITPGPAHAPSQARYAPSPARLDNRNRMSVAKPSRRPTDRASVRISDRARPRSRHASSRHPSSRREPMTARAGPSA